MTDKGPRPCLGGDGKVLIFLVPARAGQGGGATMQGYGGMGVSSSSNSLSVSNSGDINDEDNDANKMAKRKGW